MAIHLTRKQRLEWLQMRSPSMVHSTVLMWLPNAFGMVLGIILMIIAIFLALNASVGKKLLLWVIRPKAPMLEFCPQPDTSRINWVLQVWPRH